jgi:histidinol-phosphate phosphatase family protein
VKNFIFSSTCAIFGDAGERDIVESLPKNPQSPYGQTKLDVEKFLENEAKQWGLRSIALRYFNAAGAEPKLRAGEWHLAESHLIPRVLQAAVEDRAIEIFGTDYPTSDGTCIRDYIHVWDLAAAHGMAMQRLLDLEDSQKGSFEAFNLGSESGVSVRKMVATCEEVVGKKLRVEEKPRRAGDPSRLVANSSLARKVLGFGHGALDLKAVVSSAWEWEKKRVTLLRKAIFLDRDGTLNEDPGYLRDPAQIKLLPEVGEALALLKGLGFLLVVVTNQSGIGRGLIQTSALPLIHKRLDELLKPYVSKIDLYQICPHHPDDRCECRKPKPKLILDAAHILGIDVSRSYMIGDKSGDLGAGFAAGCKASILVRTGEGATTASQLQEGQATWIADSLLQAGNWILSEENAAL